MPGGGLRRLRARGGRGIDAIRRAIHLAGHVATTARSARDLQGVQHFGLTVQNMERAFEFYTEVLGGTEVMRDGDFHGERIHNTLLTDQEIEARARQVNPRALGIPDLRSGAQRLDVRFVQFDNVVIELLQVPRCRAERRRQRHVRGTAGAHEPGLPAHDAHLFPHPR